MRFKSFKPSGKKLQKFKGSKFNVSEQNSRCSSMTKQDESFKDYVLDQLQYLADVEARRMFGGYGLYQDETFFGIIHKGKLFFKIDESTVGEYRRYKMKPFRPNGKQTLKSYYQVPQDVVEDMDILCKWAVQAVECKRKTI
jgi:DNA transformation protein